MNRIDNTFKRLKMEKRKGIIAYVTAGDPDLETTEKLVLKLAESGAAMVELGVPFSDPVADGPVIQAASARALKNKVTLEKVLALAGRIRMHSDIPLLVMTYYNPVYAYGEKRFVEQAVSSGLDGVIVPDLPLEEAGPLAKSLREAGLHYIYLLAPTSSPSRIKKTAASAGGFIYCVSVAGVTGARDLITTAGVELLKEARSITDIPLALGFGISRPEQVRSLGDEADAVIIGSAIVKLVEKGGTKEEILERVGSFVDRFQRFY